MNDYYIVTTVGSVGGFWRPNDLFHDLDTAIGHADELLTLDAPPYGVAVFPIRLDWSDPRYKRYLCEASW